MMTMKLRQISLVVLLLALGLVHSAPAAFACSCAEPSSDRVALRLTDAVFAGRVVDRAGPIFSSGSNGYAIAVERAYKGTVYEKQWVFSAPQDTACGIRLTSGRRYLVFAHADDANRLFTSSCSNTHLLDGDPELETAGTILPGRSRPTPPDVGLAFLVLVVGVVAYRLGLKRSRRAKARELGT